ncbi:MAG: protein phosphatase 2C domain-containing protein [Cyanobacteria bacterium SBLK]|nr:protein phosphatase 2C domain-containing protein [Cyanobacteria bacterium SBLK]
MKPHPEELVRAIIEILSGCSDNEEIWVDVPCCHPQKVAEVSKILAQLYENIFASYLELPGASLSDCEKILDLAWQEAIALLAREHSPRQVNLDPGQNAVKEVISLPIIEPLVYGVSTRSRLIMVMADELEPPKSPQRSLGVWQYQPLPQNDPDLYAESFCQVVKTISGWQAIGARVRGKKHKHDGTHGDDWFEFRICEDWQIITVSDGAGSKKFSRVGAKVSCEAAIKYLEEALAGCKLQKRQNWSVDTFRRNDETGAFAEEDLERVQTVLHEAMRVAFDAVENAVKERVEYTQYYKSLGHRDITKDDLSATLLLAVHRMVHYKNTEYSLILTCQVGDGLTVAFDRDNRLHVLGIPDRGEFSGQTEFLTTPGKVERDYLMRKTFPFFSPLKTLFVMTDGVADDYFPADSEMFRLYGDLVLNQIIDREGVKGGDIVDRLSETKLGNLSDLDAERDKFHRQTDRLVSINENPKIVSVYACDRYAKALGISVRELTASPALLAAVHWQGDEIEKCPAENLRLWLDSYQVKGSFDDRTLVILQSPVQSIQNSKS